EARGCRLSHSERTGQAEDEHGQPMSLSRGRDPRIDLPRMQSFGIRGLVKSCREIPFGTQEAECAQEWQAQDRKVICIKRLEQMNAQALDLVSAHAGRHSSPSCVEICVEKRVAERPHGHERDLQFLML